MGEREANLMIADEQPFEPLDIDDRSPGERMIAGGRAGLGRLGEMVDDQRFDIAALLWMLCTLAFVGAGIYSALTLQGDGFSGGDGWAKVTGLATTGGPVVAISCMVGIALGVLFESAAARLALWLAAVGGIWVLVAGGLGIASVLHERESASLFFGRGNRAVGVIGALAFAGLGLVVAAIAGRLASARPDSSDLS